MNTETKKELKIIDKFIKMQIVFFANEVKEKLCKKDFYVYLITELNEASKQIKELDERRSSFIWNVKRKEALLRIFKDNFGDEDKFPLIESEELRLLKEDQMLRLKEGLK